MIPSLGYEHLLSTAAERGQREIASRIDTDREAVERLARSSFPDATSVAIDERTVGADGVSYTLRVDERRYVLKIAPEAAADRLRLGAALYRSVEAVPTPAVHTVATADSAFPYPYTIVEHVTGDELDEIPQFKAFSTERKTKLVRSLGRHLGTLHAERTFETFGSLTVDGDGEIEVSDGTVDWQRYYRTQFESHVEAATDTPVEELARAALDRFDRAIERLRDDVPAVLVHGDFTPDNAIVRDGHVEAVLDFEHAAAGASAAELWELEANVVNIVESDDERAALRAALNDGYAETAPMTAGVRRRRDCVAVGRFTAVGVVYSLLSEIDPAWDRDTFVARAERELDARRRRLDGWWE